MSRYLMHSWWVVFAATACAAPGGAGGAGTAPGANVECGCGARRWGGPRL